MLACPRSAFPLLIAVIACAPAGIFAEDWPGFLGPDRTGHSRETLYPDGWNADQPKIRWSIDVGDGYSTPAIVAGTVYHFDRLGDRSRLSAFRSSDAALLWRVEHPTDYEDYYGYSNGPRASPLVDGDRVFTYGVDGWLRSYDKETGALRWQIDTVTRYGVVQNFFGIASSPLVEGETLLVAVGGSPAGSPRIHSGAVEANGTAIVGFEKSTGKELWRTGDQLASYASPIVVTVDNRRLGLHFARGGLLGFDPVKGEELFFYPWRAERLESVNGATPVVSGNQVLITESYGPGASLLEIAGDRYRVLWKDAPGRRPRLASHWSTPVLINGFIYASSGEKSGDARLVCINWLTGETRWIEPGLRRSTLLAVDDHLVVLTEYGDLLLVKANPDRFELVANRHILGKDGRPALGYPAWGPPAMANGTLYLKGEGQLLALEVDNPRD